MNSGGRNLTNNLEKSINSVSVGFILSLLLLLTTNCNSKVQPTKLKMESFVCERDLSRWVYVRVLATANQAEQWWSDFCVESQSSEKIKEKLGPKPNDSFQEALKPLTVLAFLLFLLTTPPHTHSPIAPPPPTNVRPPPSFIHLISETVSTERADINKVSQAWSR